MADNKSSKDDLQKELDYYMTLIFNDLLLDAGLLTEEEHKRAKREFIDEFKPALAPLMA